MSKREERAAKDPLLQPFQLKHLTFRNRIISTAHEPGYAEAGMPTERYQAYHEEKAKGGVAATFTGGADIAPESNSHHEDLYLGSDEVVPHLQKLGARVRRQGAYMFCQIAHRGRRDNFARGHWLPSVAPSCVRERSHRNFPKAMEPWDFDRVFRQYEAAARRCIEGKMDGIELEAYAHLIDSFWSPLTNLRDDGYGGTIENRMRFGTEVLQAIRAEIGSDPVLGLRMVVDEARPDGSGLQFSEGLEIAIAYAESGLIDYLSVVVGHIDNDRGLHEMIPPMGTPSAPHLKYAADVKRAVGIPVFHAGRLGDVSTARYAISEGLIDLVGMCRAHIADPYIVQKIEQGIEERIRPCVGAGNCIDNIYTGGHTICLHNAATGRESTLPHVIAPSDFPGRKVVVVGAGPAGLEAARVCSLRGHQVVLFEALNQPGGQVQLAAMIERRREIISVVDWLYQEIEALGVELRFNTFAGPPDILDENPDVVIIATGGLPNTNVLSSGEELVVSTWDILSGTMPVRDKVLLFDDNGQHPGLTCAEYICHANEGVQLEIVTPDRSLGMDVGGTNYPPYYRLFYEKDIQVTLDHELISAERSGNGLVASLRNGFTDQSVKREIDQIVVERGTLPLNDLYFDLVPESRNLGAIDQDDLTAGHQQKIVNYAAGKFMLFRVGDAVASRDIHAAIHDSLRLCHCL